MSDLEKISVFIPEHIKVQMESDCNLFEIYKNDGEINFNSFCNHLIVGYDDMFEKENNNIRKIIVKELGKIAINSSTCEYAATGIIKGMDSVNNENYKLVNLEKIFIKPTNESASIISRIRAEYAKNRKASEYFRKMFISYCNKPMYIREQIIFSKKYRELELACQQKKYLTFSTISNAKIVKVMPYKIVEGQEMFNYLLCVGRNEITGEQEPRTYRIGRIENYNAFNDNEQITAPVMKRLDLMIKNGPQYVITSDEGYCVRLTPKGIKSFNRMYYGRPTEVDKKEDGEDWLYYFDASENQMFLYFRRFGPGEAEVISPKRLRDKIIRFHRDTLKMYEED